MAESASCSQPNSKIIFEDEGSIKAGSVLYSAPDKCDGYVAETDWTCTFDHDAFEIDLSSSGNMFTRLKILFQDKYRCILKRVRRGSLIFEYRHESQEAALEMMRDHVKVKDTILKCIQETDPRVHAIKVTFGYKEIKEKKRASSHPSEMKALRPGATQESELHATSREEETRKSGTPLGPGTRATPTPARRDRRADRDLREASREGNMAAVKQILAAGRADINSRGEVGWTPVMEAALGGHRDVVELLVSEGADVSLVDEDGDNILHWACWGGDVETVKFVLSLHVVDINSRGGRSQTPVMVAAWRGHRDVVELLVSEGADVSRVDEDGDNILHLACWRGNVETVKFVLSLNVVDIDARNNAGQTAADVARDEGHQEVVKLL
ncbi:ankyrin repeat domain-containing protein 2-like isoform X2 [Haliotis cracherodii]|uniref:ankyrin repeat domain-containing protein 2-like isoform X2 n=1 Tax=Haliotis cracherodii TaxID=6455 RepID=UPI0039EB042D